MCCSHFYIITSGLHRRSRLAFVTAPLFSPHPPAALESQHNHTSDVIRDNSYIICAAVISILVPLGCSVVGLLFESLICLLGCLQLLRSPPWNHKEARSRQVTHLLRLLLSCLCAFFCRAFTANFPFASSPVDSPVAFFVSAARSGFLLFLAFFFASRLLFSKATLCSSVCFFWSNWMW